MTDVSTLLIEEARTELDRERDRIDKITTRVVRFTELAVLALTGVIVLAQFATESSPIKINIMILFGGAVLGFSILASIYAVIISFAREFHSSTVLQERNLTPGSEDARKKLLNQYVENINNYKQRTDHLVKVATVSIPLNYYGANFVFLEIIRQSDLNKNGMVMDISWALGTVVLPFLLLGIILVAYRFTPS